MAVFTFPPITDRADAVEMQQFMDPCTARFPFSFPLGPNLFGFPLVIVGIRVHPDAAVEADGLDRLRG